ncbi:tRNA (guanine(26)-N(2))-dimethyltransferase-like isoform X2 [Eurosta solidaginis]|uniref:tRNA (guanine(26)-N(2))-dimethyltransferase-like isoform X2 n=1 Tax=Eurosta solidaginis TaxID=178769 RepID=UPI00353080C2
MYSKRLIREREAAAHKNAQNTNESNANDKKPYTADVKYDDGLRILEALATTGLRSLRYAKEVAGVREIVANDLSKVAVDSISVNMRHNGVEHLIVPSEGTLMYLSTSYEKRFDVIDLDPYGCPNRFLDGAIQSLTSGGLLLVTATDMAVLAGNTPEACYAKCSSVPLRMKCCHEMGLRILLHCIETHANRYGKYIEPLLSISADVYIRVFVRVHSSQAKCKYSMSKQSMIFQCSGCDTYMLQPMGIVKSKISDKGNAEVKCGIYAATTPAKEPVSCQRFSLDLEEDLQTLLEARAAPRVANMDQHESNVAVSGNAMNKIFEMEDDENKSNNANTIKKIPYNFSTKASCDETIFECQQQCTSDESCMALEKMCDKTASDPDSTLFKYIHSENKDMVIEDAKKRSADGNDIKTPCKQVK